MKIFEASGQGTLSAQVHENENTGLAKGLSYEIIVPVRCLLDLPDDPSLPRDTTITLSLIRIGQIGWRELSGKSFSFPVNPTEGYVDGSIYFSEQHYYVDLTGLRFGVLRNDIIDVELDITFNFYSMSEIPNLPSRWAAQWTVDLKLNVNAIDQAFREMI